MRTLAIATFLFSSSLYACPNLTGSFALCRPTIGDAAELTDMVVTQTVQNKITTYTVGANKFQHPGKRD